MSEPRIREDALFDGSVRRLTLDAAPGNIIDRQMVRELSEAFARPSNPGTRLLLIEGAGKHFSYGASIPEHRPEHVRELLGTFHDLARRMMTLPIPTGALVRGCCLGGGLELAVCCDLVFVEGQARLGLPEIKLGVFPPLASVLLPGRIGSGRSAELMLTGRELSGSEPHSWGLATACFASGDGLSGVGDWVRRHLLGLSAAALGFTARASRREQARRLDVDLPALERLYLDELMRTEDAREGIESFLAKRPPEWKHR